MRLCIIIALGLLVKVADAQFMYRPIKVSGGAVNNFQQVETPEVLTTRFVSPYDVTFSGTEIKELHTGLWIQEDTYSDKRVIRHWVRKE